MRSREFVNEVKMSPNVFKRFASSPEASDILVGFEAELIFADRGVLSEKEEPNYDSDESIGDIDDLRRWCSYHDALNPLGDIRGAISYFEDRWEDFVEQEIQDRKSKLADSFRDEQNENWENMDHTKMVIDRLLENGYDEQEIERFVSDNTEEFNSALDELRDEYYSDVEDDIRNESGDYEDYLQDNLDEEVDFSDFLSQEKIESVSDFYDNYNLAWPHLYGDNDELYQFDIYSAEELANDLHNALGVKVIAKEHAHNKTLDAWYIESDGSITPDATHSAELPVEIVSPPMPLIQGAAMMRKFFAWARAEQAYANKSTGLHISVSVPNMQNLDYVKLVLFLGDQYVLQNFGRLNNTYTASAFGILVKEIFKTKRNNMSTHLITSVFDKIKSGSNQIASSMISMRNPGKYVSVNVKSDYVEFRAGGNSGYIDSGSIEMVVQTMMRYAYALTIACDENMYKREYATKLTKLLSESVPHKTVIDAFVDYSLNRDVRHLKNVLKTEITKPTQNLTIQYLVFAYSYLTKLLVELKRSNPTLSHLFPKYEKKLLYIRSEMVNNTGLTKLDISDVEKNYIANFLNSLYSEFSSLIQLDVPAYIQDIRQQFDKKIRMES